MKVLIITLLTLLTTLFVTVTQAQTINEIVNSYLGQNHQPSTELIKTDYGRYKLKAKTKNYGTLIKTMRINIKLANDNAHYDVILADTNIDEVRAGTIWTEIDYNYHPVITKVFNTLEEADKYYNKYLESPILAHRKVTILKNNKKNNYAVGVVFIYNQIFIKGEDGKTIGKVKNFEKIK